MRPAPSSVRPTSSAARASGTEAAQAAVSSAPREDEMAGHRIVVADDDLDTLELMDALMTQVGFQPIICSEAEDA